MGGFSGVPCKIKTIQGLVPSMLGNGRNLFHNCGSGLAQPTGQPLAIYRPRLLFLLGLSEAGVAQLVEHLICNQRVGGSIPSASSTADSAGE